jgi:hypothetical protein
VVKEWTEEARELVMDAPKYDNAAGDLLHHGMREDLIKRIAHALARAAGPRAATSASSGNAARGAQ